jgi:hypothetical protein
MPNSPEYDRWAAACDAYVKKSVSGAVGQLLKGLEKPEAAGILREEAAAGQCSEEEARRRLLLSVERDTKKKAITAFLAKCVQPRHAVPCRAVPCRALPCRAVPCRAVPCRAVCVRARSPLRVDEAREFVRGCVSACTGSSADVLGCPRARVFGNMNAWTWKLPPQVPGAAEARSEGEAAAR